MPTCPPLPPPAVQATLHTYFPYLRVVVEANVLLFKPQVGQQLGAQRFNTHAAALNISLCALGNGWVDGCALRLACGCFARAPARPPITPNCLPATPHPRRLLLSFHPTAQWGA